MTPTAYAVPGELSSPSFCRAFAAGCGGAVVEEAVLRPGPVALFGSPAIWNVLEAAQAERRDWYYGDHRYFGAKRKFFRITKNAYQHDGTGEAGPERFEQHGLEVQPWRASGRHILVCPPGERFADLNGFNADQWLHDVRVELRRHTDRPIKVRRKPTTVPPPIPLEVDLVDCWALVTWRSNTALEALLHGIPVFPLGECAASRYGSNDLSEIESPRMPDGREQLFWNLAEQQWTLDEIARGDAWRALN